MPLAACIHCKFVPEFGLGDKVAAAIEKVGIIPTFKKDCGCAKRQQQLNDFGKKFSK